MSDNKAAEVGASSGAITKHMADADSRAYPSVSSGEVHRAGKKAAGHAYDGFNNGIAEERATRNTQDIANNAANPATIARDADMLRTLAGDEAPPDYDTDNSISIGQRPARGQAFYPNEISREQMEADRLRAKLLDKLRTDPDYQNLEKAFQTAKRGEVIRDHADYYTREAQSAAALPYEKNVNAQSHRVGDQLEYYLRDRRKHEGGGGIEGGEGEAGGESPPIPQEVNLEGSEEAPVPSEVNLDDYVRYHEMANGNFSSSPAASSQAKRVASLRNAIGPREEDDPAEVEPDGDADDLAPAHADMSPQELVEQRARQLGSSSALSAAHRDRVQPPPSNAQAQTRQGSELALQAAKHYADVSGANSNFRTEAGGYTSPPPRTSAGWAANLVGDDAVSSRNNSLASAANRAYGAEASAYHDTPTVEMGPEAPRGYSEGLGEGVARYVASPDAIQKGKKAAPSAPTPAKSKKKSGAVTSGPTLKQAKKSGAGQKASNQKIRAEYQGTKNPRGYSEGLGKGVSQYVASPDATRKKGK